MSETHESPSNAATSGSLAVTPKAGATMIRVGQQHQVFPMQSPLDELGAVNSVLQRWGLGRIQRKRDLAVARATAAAQQQLAEGAMQCQTQELLNLTERLVHEQGRMVLADLKNVVERHLEKCGEERLTGRIESLTRLSIDYCRHLLNIKNCDLFQKDNAFCSIQQQLLEDVGTLYQRQRQQIRDLDI
jgi:hypothetical protein